MGRIAFNLTTTLTNETNEKNEKESTLGDTGFNLKMAMTKSSRFQFALLRSVAQLKSDATEQMAGATELPRERKTWKSGNKAICKGRLACFGVGQNMFAPTKGNHSQTLALVLTHSIPCQGHGQNSLFEM